MPRTLEGRIVRIVDRVAYLNHDIDDAVRAGVLREEELPQEAIGVLGTTGSGRIDTLVHDMVEESLAAGDIVQGPEAGGAMDELRTFMFDHVYLAPRARREQAKVERVIATLFDHYCQVDGGPPDGGGARDADLPQRVTDYIAGMTDRYCIRAFEELALPDAVAL
jgi:dGTPase